MVVCMSWPQACITPGTVELKSRPVVSVTGRASMSPRKAIMGAVSGPMSTVAPLQVISCGVRPASRRIPIMKAVVPSSMWESSGFRCRWRRHSIRRSTFSFSHRVTY